MRQRNGGAGVRRRAALLHRSRFLVVLFPLSLPLCLALLGALLTSACAASQPGPVSVQITLQPQTSPSSPAHVEVSGLFDADLESLRDRPPTPGEWLSLLQVRVAATSWLEELPPVLGRYGVTDSAVTFTPQFPFDAGREYR